MEYIELAIEHTPTVAELYLARGRFLKHAGDASGAAKCIEQARVMDLADRYLNTRCGKYLLRANRYDDAEKILALFAKHPSQNNEQDKQEMNLREMQCMWFEIEAGKCFYRDGNYERALKEYKNVLKHFDDIQDDQFDFHNYCLRKMTLRSYVEMIKFQDRLRAHTFYVKGAKGTVETLVKLFDADANEAHLNEAAEILKVMETQSAASMDTHLLGIEVYLRSSKL